MSPVDREPTRDELLAQAYVDDELAAEERAEFERRLRSEVALRREVAELKKLELLTRQQAPPEPIDHEWSRLDAELLHAGGSRLATWLLLLGAVGGAAYGVFEVFRSDLGLLPKLFLGLACAGLLLLFLLTLRARLRTLPYDPYTQVKR